jgi:hypothetical protein
MQKDYLPAWLLPEIRLASRPALLALILFLLAGLGAVLASWGPKPVSADFDLLAAASSHKLDSTSAEPPAKPTGPAIPSEASETGFNVPGSLAAKPEDPPVVLEIPAAPDDSPGSYKIPDLPAQAPRLDLPDPTPVTAEVASDSGNLFVQSPLRGDTPMIHTWKMLGYPAILAAALTAAPSLADDNTKNSDAKTNGLADIKESLKVIDTKLNSFSLNANIMAEDIRKLKEQVAQLQKDVENLRNRSTSVSNYPSTTPSTPTTPIPPPAGRIRIVNEWPETITVFLNRTSHDVQPGQTMDADGMPTGVFTYEVLIRRPDTSITPVKPPQSRTLAANETYVIRVHPQ